MKKRDWLILATVLLVLVVWMENRDSALPSAEFACSIAAVTDGGSGRSLPLAQAIGGDECKPELSGMLWAGRHGDSQE
jgi:hypothetical protein